MTRKKVKLSYISKDSARKATYKKRKKGIIKKVSELSTLCGIEACVVISNPFGSQADVWPDLEGAKQVIEKYQNTSVKDESKNVNQESFIMHEIAKAKDRLKNQNEDNHEKNMTIAMLRFLRDKSLPDHLTAGELRDFEKLIDKKLKEIDDKIVALS